MLTAQMCSIDTILLKSVLVHLVLIFQLFSCIQESFIAVSIATKSTCEIVKSKQNCNAQVTFQRR